jgi:multicomponent Na+:H+ antiporter subunit F
MISAALIAVLSGMLLLLVRAAMGPTFYDRVLAVNSFGTKAIIAIGLLGYVMGRPDFMDIALMYALINFVATIAILKFFRYRSFQVPLSRRLGGHQDASGDDRSARDA